MASTWRVSLTMVDTKALKTTLNFIYEASGVDIGAEFADANTAMDELMIDLLAITDANVFNESLTYIRGGTASLPADADITDLGVVVTYLTGAGEVPKFWATRIPAPVAGIFEADGVTVDIADADLISYVDELSNFSVSDGENIDTSVSNGIARGWWASAKKSARQ